MAKNEAKTIKIPSTLIIGGKEVHEGDSLVAEPKSLTLSKQGKELQSLVQIETERRKIFTGYITKHMVDGIDFGRIHISRSCPNKYDCDYNKNPNHFSKPSLFKPGAEKFCSLMQLKAEYVKDEDSWTMNGSQAGMFCYICYLKEKSGNIVGEGRGSASVAEKGNVNTAVKLAEKRAKVDAVLSTGGLSDFFTQDLEDMNFDVESPKSAPSPDQKKTLPKQPVNKKAASVMSSLEQRNKIMSILRVKNKTAEDLKHFFAKNFNITSAKDLTYDQAVKTINSLSKIPDLEPIKIVESEIDLDEVDAGIQKQIAQRNDALPGAMYPEEIN